MEVLPVIAKKIKVKIGDDKKITIHVPDLPPGEADVIILKEERPVLSTSDLLALIPKHKAGRVYGTLTRDTIYTDAR